MYIYCSSRYDRNNKGCCVRITQEADYAFRIIRCLGSSSADKMGSTAISEETVVPHRFTFKILRKLTQAGITSSIRGKGGGYRLARDPKEITFLEVIEVIDGPLLINRCLEEDYQCSMIHEDGICKIHNKIAEAGKYLRDVLAECFFSDYLIKK